MLPVLFTGLLILSNLHWRFIKSFKAYLNLCSIINAYYPNWSHPNETFHWNHHNFCCILKNPYEWFLSNLLVDIQNWANKKQDKLKNWANPNPNLTQFRMSSRPWVKLAEITKAFPKTWNNSILKIIYFPIWRTAKMAHLMSHGYPATFIHKHTTIPNREIETISLKIHSKEGFR